MSPEEFVLNPRARIRLEEKEGVVTAIDVLVSYADRSPRRSRVAPDDGDDLFSLLLGLMRAEEDAELLVSDAQYQRLRDIGLLVADDVPPAVRFSCCLGEDGDEPRPLGERARAGTFEEALVVHPGFRLQEGAELPPPLRKRLSWPRRRWQSRPSFWIVEPVSGIWCPYWVTEALGECVAGFVGGEAPTKPLLAVQRERLIRAGVLGSRAGFAAAYERCRAATRAAAMAFREGRQVVLHNPLPPLMVAALRRYYRGLTAVLPIVEEPAGVPQRRTAHNEPIARWFHVQLAPLVEAVVGEPAKPSYVFSSAYLPGAVLEPHTDRPQCEWTLSLLIDYVPEPAGRAPWPIFLRWPGTNREPLPIFLGLGEGILFAGREIEHYRERLPGRGATLLLFHFVPRDFDGPLD